MKLRRLQLSILALGMLGLTLLPTAALAGKREDLWPEDDAQARQWVVEGLNHFKNVRIDADYIYYSLGENNYSIPLARIYWTNYTTKVSNGYQCALVQWKDYAQDDRPGWVQERLTRGNEKHFERFKAALDYLSEAADRKISSEQDAQFEKFKEQAKAWHDAAAKPPMPESAREHQVLAEYAFKEKNVDKAIREYAAALEIFPTWPEGQFNLGTLAAEKKYYLTAILHMEEYLELAPESADAQAAKDSVIIWKDKMHDVRGNVRGGTQ